MLTVQQALDLLLDSAKPLNVSEDVSLLDALGRVLAQDYFSPIHVPPENNSAMDGYAVNTADIVSDSTILHISQRIPAGVSPEKLQAGTAARIFTGGVMPDGADAVVMQENCFASEDGLSVAIRKAPKPNDNVRPLGQDIRQGALLFKQGHKLRPQDIGLLASVGFASLAVVSKPTVTVLATGNELLEPGKPLDPGKIYNSNKYMLSAMLQHLGCNVLFNEDAVEDSLDATVAALDKAAHRSDLVLSTGGVSVGDEDYIKPAVEKLGDIQNWKIKLKPGKPLVFGHVKTTPFIGLPGNPVSSFVTFLLFAAPFIRKLAGQTKVLACSQQYPLNFSIDHARQRPEYLRVRIVQRKLEQYPNQSSGVLASTTWADALAFIPEGRTLAVGEHVDVFLLNDLMR